MIARGPDRRYRAHDVDRLAPERRDGFDRRAMVVTAIPGTVRPGFAEAAPRVERRRFTEAG